MLTQEDMSTAHEVLENRCFILYHIQMDVHHRHTFIITLLRDVLTNNAVINVR